MKEICSVCSQMDYRYKVCGRRNGSQPWCVHDEDLDDWFEVALDGRSRSLSEMAGRLESQKKTMERQADIIDSSRNTIACLERSLVKIASGEND